MSVVAWGAAPAAASQGIETFTASTSTTQAGAHPDLTIAFSLDQGSGEAADDVTIGGPTGLAVVLHPHLLLLRIRPGRMLFADPGRRGDDPRIARIGLGIPARHGGDLRENAGGRPVRRARLLDPDARPAGDGPGRHPFCQRPRPPHLSRRAAPVGAPAGSGPDARGFRSPPPTTPSGFPWGRPAAPARRAPAAAWARSSPLPQTPFVETSTDCFRPQHFGLTVTTHEDPEHSTSDSSSFPKSTGCDQLSFNPSVVIGLTTEQIHSKTGADIELNVPQTQSPTAPSPSYLETAEIAFTGGLRLDEEAAWAQLACNDAQVGFGTEILPTCPAGAKLGTVAFDGPAFREPLIGDIYFGGAANPLGGGFVAYLLASGSGVQMKQAMFFGS